jgi:hypothetical protein
MTDKEAILHDQRLTRFLLSQIHEIRSNFHDIWTDMELENHEQYLEMTATALENAESHIKMSLECLENLQPEDVERLE